MTRLCVDTSRRLITIDASTVIPEIPGYALNSVLSIFGDSAIPEYIGEDENDLRYVLCKIGEKIATFDNAIGFGDSEYFDCDYVNSKGSGLFIVQKGGVNYLAAYVAPVDSAYDSAGVSTSAPDESKGNPCVAAPIIAGSVLTAVLTRKRK